MRKCALSAMLLIAAVGCGSGGPATSRLRDSGTPPAEAVPEAAAPGNDAAIIGVSSDANIHPIPPEAAANGCTGDATNFVYVVGFSPASFATSLYKFAPDKKVFTLVGNLNCPGNGGVNSMAVDRKGIAWVNWGNQVYQVSTKDATCTAAAPINLATNWAKIGMGFTANAAGSESETLFVTNLSNGMGTAFGSLATLASTGALGVVGQLSGSNVTGFNAELTGTGDGRLYAFFIKPDNRDPSVDPILGLVDKTNASVSKAVTLAGISAATSGNNCTNGAGCIQAWAFSFWGGHFYFYTAAQQNSMVTDYDPFVEAGTGITLNYATAPLQIVGAGVSTCAPTKPPNVK